MSRDEFLQVLAHEGFPEAVTVTRAANAVLSTHTHAFEAKALVVAGDITIRTAQGERHYAVGDVFHLCADESHSECYGENGVTYLAGRK